MITTCQREREMVKSAYKNSRTWGPKVDKMTDKQVIAIYFRFRREGKLA